MISAIIIDSREPDSIKNLKFGDIPTTVTALDSGDLLVATDDGYMLSIERKTTDDFLGSLKDERLFPQLAKMAQIKYDNQIGVIGKTDYYPYLVIVGTFYPGPNGHVVSDRGETGWSWAAVQGALLSIQEMGVFVTYAANDLDFANCVMRLGSRNRAPEQLILPPRPPKILGHKAAFIASLPGIGVERCMEVMRWAGNNPIHALWGLTDLKAQSPISVGIRQNIRKFLGLEDGQELFLDFAEQKEMESVL